MKIFGIKQLQNSQIEVVSNNNLAKTSDGKYQYKLSKEKTRNHSKKGHSGRLDTSVTKKVARYEWMMLLNIWFIFKFNKYNSKLF